MIVFKQYNPDNNCNCVVRSLSKIINKDVKLVEKELIDLSKNMEHNEYTDIEVFEKYMNINNIEKIESISDDIQIKDLDFSDGNFVVFCSNKDTFYHLVSIIDNVIYDKQEDVLTLYPISIYKENN